MSFDGYFDEVLSLAEKIENHGLDEVELRKRFDKLGQEVEAKRLEAIQAFIQI